MYRFRVRVKVAFRPGLPPTTMDGDSEDDFRNEDAELDEEDGDDDELDRQLFDAIEEVAEEAATEDAVGKLIHTSWTIHLIPRYRIQLPMLPTTMTTMKRTGLLRRRSSLLRLLQFRLLLVIYS